MKCLGVKAHTKNKKRLWTLHVDVLMKALW